MNIGIDGRALQGNRTGVGRYVFELCKELDKQLPDARFFVYSQVRIDMPVVSDRWVLRVDSCLIAKYIKPILWLKVRCKYLTSDDCLDIFWGAATFLPSFSNSLRTIITVYDLNFIYVPETMSATHRWAFHLFFKNDVARATVVTAISKGSSDRLKILVGRDAEYIVYPATSDSFIPQPLEKINRVLSKHKISARYLLAVATREPRKNLEMLINVFLKMILEGLLFGYKLVLVGGIGWKNHRVERMIAESDLIVALGFVPEQDLAPLYSGADLFIFPSLYEGYGMPVAEAIACGANVLASDTPEIREAGNQDILYIKPIEAELRLGILRGLARRRNSSNSVVRSATWSGGAKQLISAFKGETSL